MSPRKEKVLYLLDATQKCELYRHDLATSYSLYTKNKRINKPHKIIRLLNICKLTKFDLLTLTQIATIAQMLQQSWCVSYAFEKTVSKHVAVICRLLYFSSPELANDAIQASP